MLLIQYKIQAPHAAPGQVKLTTSRTNIAHQMSTATTQRLAHPNISSEIYYISQTYTSCALIYLCYNNTYNINSATLMMPHTNLFYCVDTKHPLSMKNLQESVELRHKIQTDLHQPPHTDAY